MADVAENILDAAQWKIEAEEQFKDIRSHVKFVQVSGKLGSNDQGVFFNMATLENKRFCVHLTLQGLRVVGTEYDSTSNPREQFFETTSALLSTLSPKYHNSFGCELARRLQQLVDEQKK